MRARRREINIFNMSLLDILCGSLGAFCFMMLVALPYYKPSRGDAQLRENQEKTEELLRDIEKMKVRMADVTAAADLDDLLRRLEAQIKSLEGQVNQLTAENQQLSATNEKQKQLLAQKKPILVVSTATDEGQDVDLYLQDDMVPEGGDKSANPPFDPTKPRHSSNWKNDSVVYVPGRGVVAWVSSDIPINTHFKMYVKLANEPKARKSTVINSVVAGDFGGNSIVLPGVALTPQRFWTVVGTFTSDADNKLSFKEASAEQRDADWRVIAKTEPPSVTPSPATSATAGKLSEEQMRDLRERAQKLREQTQDRQRQTAPSPSAKP